MPIKNLKILNQLGQQYIERDGDVEYELIDGGNAQEAGCKKKNKSVNGIKLNIQMMLGRLFDQEGEYVSINACVEDICTDYNVKVSDEGKVGIFMYPIT